MLKIKVLFTGGTIGSSENDGFIATDETKKYTLLEKAGQKLGEKAGFSSSEVCSVLSENMSAQNLRKIADAVKKALADSLDGIIITHGTDTLSYSAAVLSYAFAGADVPIVLVSSNFILTDERANGVENFVGAVEFIGAKIGTGVFVAYKNTGDTLKIHRGTRLLPQSPCSDSVFSISDSYYAEIRGGQLVKNESYNENEDELSPFDLDALDEKSGVLFVEAQPLMTIPSPDADVKAILIKSFHSGTIPVESAELVSFCKKAQRLSIPIFLVGAEKRTQYASVKTFSDLGINVLPTMAPSAAYVKLALTLNSGKSLDSMKKSLSGDII